MEGAELFSTSPLMVSFSLTSSDETSFIRQGTLSSNDSFPERNHVWYSADRGLGSA